MTFLLFVFVVGLAGFTVRLLVHAVVLPRVRLSDHLRQIQGYGWERAVADAGANPREQFNQAMTELARRIGNWMMTRFPGVSALQRGELTAAGFYDITPDIVHGIRAIAAIGLFLLVLMLVVVSGSLGLMTLVITFALGAAGWMLPAVVIRSRGTTRLEQIDRDLPDMIDLLIATVEAGMGIGASLRLVAPRFKGALGDELRLTIKQQSLGISNEQALNDMVLRCDTPTVRSFVRTVTRGESMGVSIGPILRELAVDARRRRRQYAEEKMRKAPVKLLFPLMLLIFPALLIELMFPAVYMLAHSL
jgi:tight adherence protein C